MREIAASTLELEQGRNRLRQVITDTEELNRVFLQLIENSKSTFSEFGTGIDTFARLKRSVESSGLARTNDELLALQKTILQLAATSGRSNIEITQGLRQLFQGIASNRLSGDELRSVLENISPIADVIAESLGVTRGELRQLGEDGRLTTRVLVEAFEGASDSANERFGRIQKTLQQTQAAQFNTTKDVFLANIDEMIGVTESFQKVLEFVAAGMDDINDRAQRQNQQALSFGLVDESLLAGGFVPVQERAKAIDDLLTSIERYQASLDSGRLTEENAERATNLLARAKERLNDVLEQENSEVEYNIRLTDNAILAQQDHIRTLEDRVRTQSFLERSNKFTGGATGFLYNLIYGDEDDARLALGQAERILDALQAKLRSLFDDAEGRSFVFDEPVPTEDPLGFTEFTQNYERMLRQTRAQIKLLELDLEEAREIGTDPLRPDAILDPRTVEAIEAEIARLQKILDGAAEGGFNLARALAQIDRQIAMASADPLAPFLEIQARLDSFRAAGASESDLSTLGGRLADLASARAISSNNQQIKKFIELQKEVTTQVEDTNAALLIERDYLLGNIDAEEKAVRLFELEHGTRILITETMREQVRLEERRRQENEEILERLRRQEQLRQQVISGITGSFYDAFQQLLDGSAKDLFRNFFEGVARSFTDAIIQDWSDRLGDYLFDIFFGGPGGGGSGFFSRLFTGRQYGGPVSAGRGYTINEGFGQREIFFPGTDGYIHPNTGGLGGAIYITASTTVNGSVRSDDDLRQISEQQEIVASNVLNKAMQQWKYRRFPNQIGT